MKIKYLVQILTFCFVLYSNPSFAQSTKQNEYYIEIKNVNNKQQARELETLIKTKAGVSLFVGSKIPVAYHILKSTKIITKAEFEEWLKPIGYQLIVFEDKIMKRGFVLLKQRELKKKNNPNSKKLG